MNGTVKDLKNYNRIGKWVVIHKCNLKYFNLSFQLLLSFPHILEVRGKPHQKYIIQSEMLNTPRCIPPARIDVTLPPRVDLNRPQGASVDVTLPRQESTSSSQHVESKSQYLNDAHYCE